MDEEAAKKHFYQHMQEQVDALVEAHYNGELSGVAIIRLHKSGSVAASMSHAPGCRFMLLGGITMAQYDMSKGIDESDD